MSVPISIVYNEDVIAGYCTGSQRLVSAYLNLVSFLTRISERVGYDGNVDS